MFLVKLWLDTPDRRKLGVSRLWRDRIGAFSILRFKSRLSLREKSFPPFICGKLDDKQSIGSLITVDFYFAPMIFHYSVNR